MVCPHCGFEAGTSSFCPACSRLVNSPLLGMHRELAASRGKTYGAEGIAAAAAARVRDMAAARDRKHAAAAPASAPARPDRGQMSEAMRKALDRRERKARERQRDEDDDGAASSAARAQHSDRTHTVEDTSAPPPIPQTKPTKVEATLDRFPRPASISILALLNAFAGLTLLGMASVLVDNEQLRPLARDTMAHYLAAVGGALHVLAALGLWGMRPFGRAIQKLLAFFWFFLVPFGTVYAIIVLAYFGTTGMKALFSGRSPRAMKAAELDAARKTLKFAPVMAMVLFVLAILPAMAVASFVSSVLPTLVEMAEGARVSMTGGQEAEPAAAASVDPDGQALQDVQAVMQAQAAYASLGGGLYDRLECVSTPAACLGTADPRNDIVLLDPRFLQSDRNGYRFRLILGKRPLPRPEGASATGVDAYAYVATNQLGSGRAICGDATGAVVALDAPVADALKLPACPMPE